MKMNLAVQCIIILACMVICSSLDIPKCRCLKSSKGVNPSLITGVQEFGLRPYCNRREVIVTLKDGSEWCLDPEAKFTKALLQRMKQIKGGSEVTISQNTTTVSTPVSVIVSTTASATEVPLQVTFCQKLQPSRRHLKSAARRWCLDTQGRFWKPRAAKSAQGGIRG